MPPLQRKPLSPLGQLLDLFLIELTNWRWSWRSMLITATIAPLGGILGLGLFARDLGPPALAYVLSGNAVLSLLFGTLGSVESHVSFMRFAGALDYFGTLPIRRSLLILAVVLAFLLLSLPSLLVTIALGALVLGLPLALHPAIVLVVPLCALPLAGLGALIGFSVRTPEEGNSMNLLVTFGLTGLGPVIVPPDRLPAVLVLLGRLSPATYAASALRQVLLGPVTGQLLVDSAVLAGFAMVMFWVAGKKMSWRRR